MLRLSCFSDSNGYRTKKQAPQPSFGKMLKMLQVGSQKGPENTNNTRRVNRPPTETMGKIDLINRGWRSGEIEENRSHVELPQDKHIRRRVSFESALTQEGTSSKENSSGDHTQKEFFVNESHNHQSPIRGLKSPLPTMSPCNQDSDQSPHGSYGKKSAQSGSSERDRQYLEKEETVLDFSFHNDDEYAGDFGNHMPQSLSGISKSLSVPNFASASPQTWEESESPPGDFEAVCNRSCEDLNPQNLPDDNEGQNEIQDDWYDSYKYAASNKDWIVPVIDDEEYVVNNLQEESSSFHGDQMPSKDFMIKRIQDWVIELPERDEIEETEEVLDSHEQLSRQEDGRDAAKSEMKMNPVTIAAMRYVSSLGASAAAAQLANHGLTEVPFLSAFVSLKVVNLSGNSIAKITAGSLPRGLHMLNLSKNKISNIEGLRELTRLRVLDLSYNKITRIGRGLAYCSSLKELFIAGNKISEVEGLHRLLKLTVLDLSFNKISTTKCLGQLAANYNSLQAINLEGNPAQKNVGNEQLKKYLQGLLPHLAYYNRLSTTKASSLKESSDRSIRLGGAAHQFDRTHKSDQKSRRSGLGHGSKQAGHRGQGTGVEPRKGASSKGSNMILPPTSSSRSHQYRHHRNQQAQAELTMKPLDLAKELAIRKSQSVGSFAAL